MWIRNEVILSKNWKIKIKILIILKFENSKKDSHPLRSLDSPLTDFAPHFSTLNCFKSKPALWQILPPCNNIVSNKACWVIFVNPVWSSSLRLPKVKWFRKKISFNPLYTHKRSVFPLSKKKVFNYGKLTNWLIID